LQELLKVSIWSKNSLLNVPSPLSFLKDPLESSSEPTEFYSFLMSMVESLLQQSLFSCWMFNSLALLVFSHLSFLFLDVLITLCISWRNLNMYTFLSCSFKFLITASNYSMLRSEMNLTRGMVTDITYLTSTPILFSQQSKYEWHIWLSSHKFMFGSLLQIISPLFLPKSESNELSESYNWLIGTQYGGYLNLAVSITSTICLCWLYPPMQEKWPDPVYLSSFRP